MSQLPTQTTANLPAAHINRLLLGLALATGMEFYVFDAMNLILVDLAGTLGVSFDEASWLLTVYSSTLFLGVPICIWMAGHFGYKRYLIATIMLFAIASVGCMLAPNLDIMLLCRAMQGFAGAGLVMWWRAAIYLLMPKPQRSPSLMRVSFLLYLSSATGLVLGGWLTDHFTWRYIFLPVIPYTAGAIWLIYRYFPTSLPDDGARRAGTDWLGIALLAVSLVSLQVMLNRGHIDDWLEAPHIRLLCWLAVTGFAGFVWWQTSPRNRVPLLCLDLLADRYVLSSALIGLFTGAILSGSLFVLPDYLRRVASPRLSATQTGEIMCIYALSAAALRPLMITLIAYLGQRRTIAGALAALICAMLLFNRLLTVATPAYYYAVPLMLYALCLSPLLPAVGSGTVARIDQHKLLDGVSIYMTFRQCGASLGVAWLTALIENRETLHSSRLFQYVQMGNGTTTAWLAQASASVVARAGLSPHDAAMVTTGLLHQAGARQSTTLADADAFLFMAVIGVFTLCLIPVIPPTPPARK